MPRGGKREGTGRKPPKEEYTTVSYYLPTQLIDSIVTESEARSQESDKVISASAIAEQWLTQGQIKTPCRS